MQVGQLGPVLQGYLFLQSTRPGAGYNFGRVIGGGVATLPIQDKKSLKNTNLRVREGMIYLINFITFA